MSENIYTEIDGRDDILKVVMSYRSLTGTAAMWVDADGEMNSPYHPQRGVYPNIESNEDGTSAVEYMCFAGRNDIARRMYFSAIEVTLDKSGFYDGTHIGELPTEARLMFTKFISSARAFHGVYSTGIHDEFGSVGSTLRFHTFVELNKFAVVATHKENQ